MSSENFPFRRRLAELAAILLLAGLALFFSVHSIRQALTDPELSPWLRGLLFVVSGLMIAFAGSLIVSPLQRKWKTGRFFLTPAEAAAKRAEYRSLMGAGKPFGPQMRFWILPAALMLMLAGIGIFALVAAFNLCNCDRNLRLPALLFAALFLALPGFCAFKIIRRKMRTGSVLPSQQELDRARAKCATPKSLRQRLLMAGIWCFIAVMWTTSAVERLHRHSATTVTWVNVGVGWLAAAIWTWQLFRPQRPLCALDEPPEEQHPGLLGN